MDGRLLQRAHGQGEALDSYTPQQRTLYLLSLGKRRALASWGRWSIAGDWVWRWKDHIDRQFVTRYSGRAEVADDAT